MAQVTRVWPLPSTANPRATKLLQLQAMSTAQYGRLYDAFQQPHDEDRVTAREACTLFRFAVLVTSLFLIWKAAFQPAQWRRQRGSVRLIYIRPCTDVAGLERYESLLYSQDRFTQRWLGWSFGGITFAVAAARDTTPQKCVDYINAAVYTARKEVAQAGQ